MVTTDSAATATATAAGGIWHEVLDTNTNCIYYWNQQDNITSWVIPTNATVVKLQSSTDTGKSIVTVNKLCVMLICDWACENQLCECKNHRLLSSFLYHNLQTICTNKTKSPSLL